MFINKFKRKKFGAAVHRQSKQQQQQQQHPVETTIQ